MKSVTRRWCLRFAAMTAMSGLAACGSTSSTAGLGQGGAKDRSSTYIASILDEPDTTDFQCTTINYTVALNVFDRLVETRVAHDGGIAITPSLAESWDVSKDGITYTFHLRPDVTFSNGSPLTSSDVEYTFKRLLTHPDACNQDIASEIVGAQSLAAGEADELKGFKKIDDLSFEITLEQPFSAFLACLCMPGASILDQKSTEEAGERFGIDPASTIGTGPYVFEEWVAGEGLRFAANPAHWNGAPKNGGVDLRFVYEPETIATMYKNGELDIINVDDLGDLSEFYLHGNAYEGKLHTAGHVGIDYIVLNESVEPLGDVRVRKALQLALNRQALLDAAYNGEGVVENGIFPHGLYGFNPNLPAIPYDQDEAARLLTEAGYANGFDLEIGMRSTSTHWQRQLMDMVANMWTKVGVRANVSILGEEEFMAQRTSGKLACYTASWAADFDDPDNFIYTFFGSRENAVYRSLCYNNDQAIARVRAARSILDARERLKEYHDLERLIIQEEAAWVPLFSRKRHFVVSDRLIGFNTMWNGWFEGVYHTMLLQG